MTVYQNKTARGTSTVLTQEFKFPLSDSDVKRLDAAIDVYNQDGRVGIREFARNVLKEAGLPIEAPGLVKRVKDKGYAPDSSCTYAAGILDQIALGESAQARGDWQWLWQSAYSIGILVTEWRMNKDALRGLGARTHLADNRQRHNRAVHQSAAGRWAAWQGWADPIWQAEPSLANTDVAIELKRTHDIPESIRTIRMRIRKPGKAG
jgi:hypothetical protein